MVASVAKVASLSDGVSLASEMVMEIAERTDGVPLFVEELTKAVLEAGAQAPEALSIMPHAAPPVPATLHASLMARLDRLGTATREVAQAGAVIGREFSHTMLAAITELPEPQLRDALDRLTSAGLVFTRGALPEASYLFKHALVQDAAYGSLLRSRRQGLHCRVVAALEAHLPEVVQAQPALLAQHCQEAGLPGKAVDYWLIAGQQALGRSAMAEAVAQLRKGLRMLDHLPDSLWRQHQELDLQAAFVTAMAATKGWADPDVVPILAQARALAERLDRQDHLVPLFSSQFWVRYVHGEYSIALSLAEQHEIVDRLKNDVKSQLTGHLHRGIIHYVLGEFVAARAFLEQCMDLGNPAYQARPTGLSDPYTVMLNYLGMTLASLGYIDQARSWLHRSTSEVRRRKHVYTLVDQHLCETWVDWITGSPMVHADDILARIMHGPRKMDEKPIYSMH
jgi:tetratricopeptide (TPR) repeat protein